MDRENLNLSAFEKANKINYYEISCETKRGVSIDCKPYRRLTNFEPLFRLFEKGNNEIKEMMYQETLNELERLSEIQDHFIFRITIHTWDRKFYRYWFLNGRSYGIQGELIFEEYDKNKLK